MRKSRFSDKLIIKMIKEVESGKKVKDVCQTFGISDATYYQWKSKHIDIETADLKKLRELEYENNRLKQMYADISLEFNSLKKMTLKKNEVE